ATRLRDFRHPLTLALKCPSPTAIPPLSLHDALPICPAPATGSPVSDAHHTPHPRHAATQPPRHAAGGFRRWARRALGPAPATLGDRKSTRLNSSHVKISYAVFCLKKKKNSSTMLYTL